MTLPLGLRAYRWATEAGAPLVRAWLNRRVRQGREDPDRLGERYGRPGAPRPEGSLVWLHSASVGEGRLSAAMAESLRARIGEVSVLFTCQTRTAADLFAELATADASAQYAPVDTGDAVGAFLDHWRPDLAVWVESELWPNLVVETARRAVPMALINARLSTRAARAWARTPQSARFVLNCFDWIGAIEAETATLLSHLADRPIAALGNLKNAAPAPKADPVELNHLGQSLGHRRVWLAASTHEGEEALLCDALDPADEAELLILAPRHPDRGDALADMLDARGLAFARRSIGEAPLSAHKVLLADTLGEMGLWLRLSRMAFIGGSWVDGVGGHNPVEAARLATPMAVGPYTANFTTLYNDLEAAGGCARVRTTDELRTALNTVFSDVTRGRRYADAAIGVVDAATAAWPKTLDALEALWTQRRTEDAEMTEAGADA